MPLQLELVYTTAALILSMSNDVLNPQKMEKACGMQVLRNLVFIAPPLSDLLIERETTLVLFASSGLTFQHCSAAHCWQEWEGVWSILWTSHDTSQCTRTRLCLRCFTNRMLPLFASHCILLTEILYPSRVALRNSGFITRTVNLHMNEFVNGLVWHMFY